MNPLLTTTFPIVDLAAAFSSDVRDRVSVAADIRNASRGIGIFCLTNHGVPDAIIAGQFELARSFFALTFAEKEAIDVSRSDSFRGYTAFATRTIDASAPGDLKEGFIMGPDLPPGHPHVVARFPNTGTNQWPPRRPYFRARMENYVAEMNRLGRCLASILALSLDLPEDYFAAALSEPLTYSQLMHYPSVPPSMAMQHFGAGTHVDWGMLTILLQDDVGGLEYRTRDGEWHAAPPVPGTFVIILGEMMLRLTNGRYGSAPHRVMRNTTGRSRYSMPTFFDPDYDYRVACVPTCLPATGEPRYPARTVAEHMHEMAQQTLSAQ